MQALKITSLLLGHPVTPRHDGAAGYPPGSRTVMTRGGFAHTADTSSREERHIQTLLTAPLAEPIPVPALDRGAQLTPAPADSHSARGDTRMCVACPRR